MRLKRLILENYKVHDNLVVDLTPGLIGIMGTNGSGKSSVISALCYALTGNVLGDDNKNDLLKWGVDKGFVKLIFEESNKEYTLVRNLHNSTVTLRTDKEETIKGKKAIDVFIEQISGLTPNVVDKVVFIAQEQLDAPFRSGKSSFINYFNSLFKTDIAEKLRSDIQTIRNKIPVYKSIEDIKDLKSRILKRSEDIERNKLKLEKIKERSLKESTESVSCRLNLPTQDDIVYNIKELEEGKKYYQNKLCEMKIDDLEEPNYLINDVDRQEYRDYKDFNALKNKYEDYEKEYTKQKLEIDKLGDTDYKSTLSEKKEYLFQLNSIKTMYENNGCPTCGRKNNVTKQIYEDTCKQLPFLIKKISSLEQVCKTKEIFNRLTQARAREEEEYKKILNSTPEGIIHFDENLYVKREKETYAYNAALRKNKDQLGAKNKLEIQIQNIETKIENLKQEPSIEKKEAIELKAIISIINKTKLCIAELSNKISMMEEDLKSLLESYQNHLALDEKIKKHAKVAETLDNIRNLLHREKIPAYVTRHGLSGINQKLAEYLNVFEFAYPVIITKDFDLIFQVGGNSVDYKSLSGGQKKVVALAFRFAIAELLAGDIGLLVLDEPTAYLDDVNIEFVGNALKKIQSYTKAKGMIIPVATHEQALKPFLTNNIKF